MKILVTGATGHVGSYLVPHLIKGGYQVTACARTGKPKYNTEDPAWEQVEWLTFDIRAEEESGTLIKRLLTIDCDAVVDLISFTSEQNQMLIDAFAGRVKHFIHCGSIWAFGPSNRVPHRESDPSNPTSDYGKAKIAIEKTLLQQHKSTGTPITIVHIGHVCGRDWLPIDPLGAHSGLEIYKKLAQGKKVVLPRDGMPALHHVHSADVAQLIGLALANPEQAIGESFSVAAPYGMTLKGCCQAVAEYFGTTANLEFGSMEEFKEFIGIQAYNTAVSHMRQSIVVSIDKAKQLLGYTPLYTTEAIYAEFLDHTKISL